MQSKYFKVNKRTVSLFKYRNKVCLQRTILWELFVHILYVLFIHFFRANHDVKDLFIFRVYIQPALDLEQKANFTLLTKILKRGF